MGLVDDDEAVVVPVEVREIVIANKSRCPGKVGVGKNIEAKSVVHQGIEAAVGFEDGPVRAEFFRAEDEDAFVAEFEVFDDGEGFEGFAKADAVGEDAAVEFEQLVDRALCTVALE